MDMHKVPVLMLELHYLSIYVLIDLFSLFTYIIHTISCINKLKFLLDLIHLIAIQNIAN
jgi:hypothetical protein